MGANWPWNWKVTDYTYSSQDDPGQTINDQLQDDGQSWLCCFYK